MWSGYNINQAIFGAPLLIGRGFFVVFCAFFYYLKIKLFLLET